MEITIRKIAGIFLAALLLFCPLAWGGNVAGDSAIFGGGVVNVKPNILIIFDNSGSMNWVTSTAGTGSGQPGSTQQGKFDPGVTYDYKGYNVNWVYRGLKNNPGGGDIVWEAWVEIYDGIVDADEVLCKGLRDNLNKKGWESANWTKIKEDTSCCTGYCPQTEYVYRTGNYLNYTLRTDEISSTAKKIEIACDTLVSMLEDTSFNTDNVRLGLMVFNSNNEGGYVYAPMGSSAETIISSVQAIRDAVLAGHGTNTPLTETLAEAGLYFARQLSWFNTTGSPAVPVDYATAYPAGAVPSYAAILARCEQNHIIILTDGEPTQDDNSKLNKSNPYMLGEYLSPSTGNIAKLNDVARFLYTHDLLREPLNDINGFSFDSNDFEKQNIKTWTIGFDLTQAEALTLLEDTAKQGGGKYYTTTSGLTLDEILSDIFANISNENAQYVAPVVPVNRLNRTFADNAMYLGVFAPQSDGLWKGNIKKFGLRTKTVIENGEEVIILQITDRYGNDATDADGLFYSTAHSAWYEVPGTDEGLLADLGGVGAVLNEMSSRTMFTVKNSIRYPLATSTDVTSLTPEDFGLTTEDERNDIINYVTGKGIYDPGGTNDLRREWLLGDILHSRPAILYDYTGGKNVLIVGANDGFLHCFVDDDKGTSSTLTDDTVSEAWAYAPYDILKNLSYLPPTSQTSLITGDKLQDYFVDGSPVIYETDASVKYVTVGLRRGSLDVAATTELSNLYFTLNITDYTDPSFAWQIPRTIISTAPLGQSWSTPQYCKVKTSETSSQEVLLLTGGYDVHQDDVYPGSTDSTTTDTKGCSVLMVDVANGSLFKSFTGTNMQYSIVDFTAYDDNGDGCEDVIYAPDLGGNLYVFEDKDLNGVWNSRKLFAAPNSAPSTVDSALQHNYARKFFDAPGIAQISSSVEYAYIGSGDREHPTNKNEEMVNRFYAIKNIWGETSTITGDTNTVTGLINVTPDVTQGTVATPSTLTEAEKTTWRESLMSERGWFIDMEDTGEKIVSTPTVFAGVVYFTSFVPGADESSTDTCSGAGNGTAYFWAVDYKTGEAVFEYDGVEGLTKEDRRLSIGSGMPSASVVIVTEEGSFIGAATQNKIPLKSTSESRGVYRYFWRQY